MNNIKLLSIIIKNYNNFYTHQEMKIELNEDGDLYLVGCEHCMGFIIPLLESLKYHTITMYRMEDANTIKVW